MQWVDPSSRQLATRPLTGIALAPMAAIISRHEWADTGRP